VASKKAVYPSYYYGRRLDSALKFIMTVISPSDGCAMVM
jgi:hypothetical protein